MFASIALAALLASSAIVRADVVPDTPGPGEVFNEGTQCKVTWNGDSDSTSNWKDMSIQLMSGDNFNMIPVTTVTTGQDGTTSGQFTYPCPDVSPNSAIYFYQFTSPHTTDKAWTTRFTIAAADGSTTPPQNQVQPGSGDKIPWGVGALTDQSKVVPPPAYLSGGSTPSNATTPSTSQSSSTATSKTASPTGFSTVRPASASASAQNSASASASASSPSGSSNSNGAGVVSGSWKIGGATVVSVLALSLFL